MGELVQLNGLLFLTAEKTMGCTSNKMALTTISEDEKRLVKDSWNLFVSRGDFSDTGSHMYKVLLQDNPHLKTLFSFMKVNGAPFDSPMFKSHVRNVFTVIGDAVNHIDDLDSLSPILKDLGVKHQGYGAKKEYLEPVGNALLCTIEKHLEDDFTQEVHSAWRTFFAVMSYSFAQGLDEDNGKDG
ncbi:neuroglobin isoform X2 [Magallana gigas]|uniref:Nitrite reductase n=4 Tax=Magallana gigas TaxID=29159 RepID=A0A8W8I2R9_MAGGI|nr:neuroglobin isoform X1 [Crassostrea gigas]|eukprot:XP_011445784.1 PREDICTED: neuroglobin isoform X1 [Crassostrea gigas]